MNKQKFLHEFMEKELYRYEKLYSRLEREADSLPKGSIAVDDRGRICRYLNEDGRQYRIILTQKEADLFLSLKKRRYIKKGLKTLKSRTDPNAPLHSRRCRCPFQSRGNDRHQAGRKKDPLSP